MMNQKHVKQTAFKIRGKHIVRAISPSLQPQRLTIRPFKEAVSSSLKLQRLTTTPIERGDEVQWSIRL